MKCQVLSIHLIYFQLVHKDLYPSLKDKLEKYLNDFRNPTFRVKILLLN